MIIFFRSSPRRCCKCSHFAADVSWNRKWPTIRYRNQTGYGVKKLDELNCNKSNGPDEIHPRLLKELSSVIAEPLAKPFQNSLVQDVVPNDWREANITELFKKGSKSASQNYRPVSLTSVICKQMESIIKDEIIKHWNIFKLINGSQHGFTKGRSCVTNLLEFFWESYGWNR